MSQIAVDYNVLNQRGTPAWFSANFADIPTAGVTGRMFISIDTFAFYRDTGTGWDLIGGPGTGSITGTGTTNYLTKFSSSSIITSSLLFDNGTYIGINTNTPTSQLQIVGTFGDAFNDGLRITRNGTPSQFGMFNVTGGANNFIAVNTTTGEPAFVYSTSTDGINRTTRMTINSGSHMLDVTGSGRFTGLLTGTNATFSALVTSVVTTGINATFNSTNATGSVINFKRSGTNYGYLGNSGELGIGTLNAFELRADNDLYLTTTSGKLSILSTGNVGIGTITPGNNLEIVSATNPNMALTTASSSLYVYYGMNSGSVGGALFTFSQSYVPGNYNAGSTALTNNTWGVVLAATSATGVLTFNTNNNLRMTIAANGNIGAPSGTNIYNASDLRLKQNITTITDALNKIILLNPVKFNWIDGFEESENEKDMLGFIAQEVQSIIPEAVESFSKNSVLVKDIVIENPLRVNEKFIIPVLVKAIQELNEKLVKNNIN